MATPTHSRDYSEMLTPEETAFVLIDHRAGLILYPHDLDPLTLRSNSIALAKTAKLFQCPVILTAADQGPKGPILPEIASLFPDVQPIYRTKINSWHEPAIKKAIEATGRKKLVLAGITSDFCSGLPAKSAAAAGYYSYLVMDASGPRHDLDAVFPRQSDPGRSQSDELVDHCHRTLSRLAKPASPGRSRHLPRTFAQLEHAEHH
jgi:hypothetical protein